MSLFSSLESPDLTLIDASHTDVSLPDGDVESLADVQYDTSTGRFYYGKGLLFAGVDVTPYLSRAQKNAFPSYDPTADNIAMSDASGNNTTPNGPVAQPSMWDLFTGGVADDVGGLRKFVTGEGQGFGFNLKTILLGVAVLAGLWLVFQIVKSVPAKKA